MRVDGSIKSMTTGLSTVDKSQWEGRQYMKECVNMRNDSQDGLQRRPPADLILSKWVDEQAREITEFDPTRDVLLPFEIDNDQYWMYATLSETGSWFDHTVHVFDVDGNNVQCVNLNPNYQYLFRCNGSNNVKTAVNGDSIYVLNTRKQIEEIDGSQPVAVPHSLVVVQQAPKVYQTIVVEWEYEDQTQSSVTYVVSEDHPTQPPAAVEDVDNGVNTIADFLAAKIVAQIATDGQTANMQVDSAGGTIVFRRLDGSGGIVPGYSAVVVTDGDTDVIAINGEVQNVIDLPRYAHSGELVQVRPDPESDRAAFYMRSELVLGDEVTFPLPAPDYSFVAGEDFPVDDVIATGFQGNDGGGLFATFGTWGTDPDFDFDTGTYPEATWSGLKSTTDFPIRPSQSTTVEAWLNTTVNTPDVPPEALQYLECWDMTASPPKRKFQVFMYQEVNEPAYTDENGVNQPGTVVWRGTFEGGDRLQDGRTYNYYTYDVAASQTLVPEVRWVEESAPGENTLINTGTFVHVLHRKGDGTFEFGDFASVNNKSAKPLVRRTSGDDESNPMPAFVGFKARDVATFQNRLVLLSRDRVSMSVTGQPHDWFRGTVVQLLDTSPINIQSTSADATSLRHFVQHNNDLLVFGPNGQFKLSGDIAMTPSTASMSQAAKFPADVRAEPKTSGNEIFFPSKYGPNAGLNVYNLDKQIDGLADMMPLLDKQMDLIPGTIQQIEVAPNLGMLAVRSTNFKEELWVMEYEPREPFFQSQEPSWTRWVLDWGVRVYSMRMDEDKLDIITIDKAVSTSDPGDSAFCIEGYDCTAWEAEADAQGMTRAPMYGTDGADPPWFIAPRSPDPNYGSNMLHWWVNWVAGPTLPEDPALTGGTWNHVSVPYLNTVSGDNVLSNETWQPCAGPLTKYVALQEIGGAPTLPTAMTIGGYEGSNPGQNGDYAVAMQFLPYNFVGEMGSGTLAQNSGKFWNLTGRGTSGDYGLVNQIDAYGRMFCSVTHTGNGVYDFSVSVGREDVSYGGLQLSKTISGIDLSAGINHFSIESYSTIGLIEAPESVGGGATHIFIIRQGVKARLNEHEIWFGMLDEGTDGNGAYTAPNVSFVWDGIDQEEKPKAELRSDRLIYSGPVLLANTQIVLTNVAWEIDNVQGVTDDLYTSFLRGRTDWDTPTWCSTGERPPECAPYSCSAWFDHLDANASQWWPGDEATAGDLQNVKAPANIMDMTGTSNAQRAHALPIDDCGDIPLVGRFIDGNDGFQSGSGLAPPASDWAVDEVATVGFYHDGFGAGAHGVWLMDYGGTRPNNTTGVNFDTGGSLEVVFNNNGVDNDVDVTVDTGLSGEGYFIVAYSHNRTTGAYSVRAVKLDSNQQATYFTESGVPTSPPTSTPTFDPIVKWGAISGSGSADIRDMIYIPKQASMSELEGFAAAWARNFAEYDEPYYCDLFDQAITPEESAELGGQVRLYRFDLHGDREIRRRFTRDEERFGDVYLDCRQTPEEVTDTIVLPDGYPAFDQTSTWPYESTDIVVVQGKDCPVPGDIVTYTRDGDTLTLDEDMGGGQVWYGYNYPSYIRLPDVDVRDAKGTIMEDAAVRVSDWQLTLTGYVDALVDLRKELNEFVWQSTYPVQEWRGVELGNAQSQTDSLNVNRGTFRIQFRQSPDNADLTLVSHEYVTMDIHQMEWRGTYFNSGRRF